MIIPDTHKNGCANEATTGDTARAEAVDGKGSVPWNSAWITR